MFSLGFVSGSSKESSGSVGDAKDMGSIPESGRYPGEGNGNILQYSCWEKWNRLRRLVGYSPQGHVESDTTENGSIILMLQKKRILVSLKKIVYLIFVSF